MAYSFGDDAFFLQLKEADASGDRERLAELAYRGFEPIVAMELKKSAFAMFTPEDRQDAKQEAVLYALEKLGAFLRNPLNDPSCGAPERYTPVKRQAWAHRVAYHALLHVRDKIRRHALSPGEQRGTYRAVDSLDRKLADGSEGSVGDFIPSERDGPEARVLMNERLEEACRAFFGLNNAPELLAAVGFVILSESLTGVHRSLEAYAEQLNGMSVGAVAGAMKRLLGAYGVDGAALDGLMRRLDGDGHARRIGGLTARTLANRKNSMLTRLRSDLAEEREE